MSYMSPKKKVPPLEQFLTTSPLRWLLLFAVFFTGVAVNFIASKDFNDDFLAIYSTPPSFARSPRNSPLVIMFDFGDGRKRMFQAYLSTSVNGKEALDGVKDSATIALAIAPTGKITSVDAVRDSSSRQWHWYLNGFEDERPITDVLLRSGDKILFKYE